MQQSTPSGLQKIFNVVVQYRLDTLTPQVLRALRPVFLNVAEKSPQSRSGFNRRFLPENDQDAEKLDKILIKLYERDTDEARALYVALLIIPGMLEKYLRPERAEALAAQMNTLSDEQLRVILSDNRRVAALEKSGMHKWLGAKNQLLHLDQS